MSWATISSPYNEAHIELQIAAAPVSKAANWAASAVDLTVIRSAFGQFADKYDCTCPRPCG